MFALTIGTATRFHPGRFRRDTFSEWGLYLDAQVRRGCVQGDCSLSLADPNENFPIIIDRIS